jgi:hypothetical protein
LLKDAQAHIETQKENPTVGDVIGRAKTITPSSTQSKAAILNVTPSIFP